MRISILFYTKLDLILFFFTLVFEISWENILLTEDRHSDIFPYHSEPAKGTTEPKT